MYSKKVLKYFFHPKNVGVIKNPTVKVTEGSLACGDMVTLYMKVDKNDIIKDVKFKSYGCAANIATISLLTEMIKGKSIEYAKQIDYNTLNKELGGLPLTKVHCSALAIDSLKEAIQLYEEKKGIIKHERIDEEFLRKRLRHVIYPKNGKDIISSGMLKSIKLKDGVARIEIIMEKDDAFKEVVTDEIKERLEALREIKKVEVVVVK